MPARILMVEDTPHNLALMRYLLEVRGHSIIEATNGLEAMAHAREGKMDLVILDLQLGDTTGFEVLEGMRTLPQLGAVPIVAVTAFAMVGDRDKILSAGFDGYIAKPLEPQVFAEQIESFLPASLRGREQPLKHAWPDDVRSQGSNPIEVTRAETILVIDDRDQNIHLARGLLEPNGYEVLWAASIEDALGVLETRRPSLVICDIHLADANALDHLEQLQEDPRIAGLPFLFHTATAEPGDIARIVDLGGRYLFRPVDPSVLLEAVRATISEGLNSGTEVL